MEIRNCEEFAHIIECLTEFKAVSIDKEKFEVVCEDDLNSYDVNLIFRYDMSKDVVTAECNYGDEVLSFEDFAKHINKEKPDVFKNYDDSQLSFRDYLYKGDDLIEEYVSDVIGLWQDGFGY